MRYYIKATLSGGTSGHDKEFTYHLGKNTHPDPDRSSKASCGIGIHLAKSIKIAKRFVPGASEFYLAEAGEILGEDNEKVRCADCEIVRKLTEEEVKRFNSVIDALTITNPLCGLEWITNNALNVSWEDFYNQRLEIKSDKGHISISPKVKNKKDIRQAIKEVIRCST